MCAAAACTPWRGQRGCKPAGAERHAGAEQLPRAPAGMREGALAARIVARRLPAQAACPAHLQHRRREQLSKGSKVVGAQAAQQVGGALLHQLQQARLVAPWGGRGRGMGCGVCGVGLCGGLWGLRAWARMLQCGGKAQGGRAQLMPLRKRGRAQPPCGKHARQDGRRDCQLPELQARAARTCGSGGGAPALRRPVRGPRRRQPAQLPRRKAVRLRGPGRRGEGATFPYAHLPSRQRPHSMLCGQAGGCSAWCGVAWQAGRRAGGPGPTCAAASFIRLNHSSRQLSRLLMRRCSSCRGRRARSSSWIENRRCKLRADVRAERAAGHMGPGSRRQLAKCKPDAAKTPTSCRLSCCRIMHRASWAWAVLGCFFPTPLAPGFACADRR